MGLLARARRRMAQSMTAVLIGAALAGMAAYAGLPGWGGTDDRSSGSMRPASITVATAAAIDHTSVFAASELGFFEERDLTARVKKYPTGVEITKAVASGEAQFGLLGSYTTLAAAARGLPIRVVAIGHGDATATYYNANQALISGPGSGIKPGDPSTVKGKRIGLPLGSSPEAFVESLLDQAGLRRDDYELVDVLPADALSALRKRSVDAVVMFEPGPQIALEKVPGSAIIAPGEATNWYDPGVIVTNSSYLEQNPGVVEEFLTAIAKAQWSIRKNPDQAAEIATRWVDDLSLATATKSIRALRFDMRLSTNVVEGYRDLTVPFLARHNKVSTAFDPAEVVDASALNHVRSQHRPYFRDLYPLYSFEELE